MCPAAIDIRNRLEVDCLARAQRCDCGSSRKGALLLAEVGGLVATLLLRPLFEANPVRARGVSLLVTAEREAVEGPVELAVR